MRFLAAFCPLRVSLTSRRPTRFVAGLLGSLLALTFCNMALAQQSAGPVLHLSGRAARARHQEPEPVPAPKSTAQPTYRFAPIGELTLDTSATPGILPRDLAADVFGRQPPLVLAPGMTRPWPPQVFCWYGVPLHYAPDYHHGSSGLDLRCAGRAAETVIQEADGAADEIDRPGEIPPHSAHERPE